MRLNSLAFRKLGALLYLFTTETCDISLVCVKLHNTVSIASKYLEEFCVTEIWLRPPRDDQMDLIVYARPLTLRRLL